MGWEAEATDGQVSCSPSAKRFAGRDSSALYTIRLSRPARTIVRTRSFPPCTTPAASITRPVRIVHPVAVEKWITRLAKDGTTLVSRRKSPKRGSLYDLFDELVSFPQLCLHPNFSLEVVLTREEELRCQDGRGSWRRGGTSIRDHLLLEVKGREVFTGGRDFLRVLPPGWSGPSTNRELAKDLGQPHFRIARMTYCLARMGVLALAGKQGNALLYCLQPG